MVFNCTPLAFCKDTEVIDTEIQRSASILDTTKTLHRSIDSSYYNYYKYVIVPGDFKQAKVNPLIFAKMKSQVSELKLGW